MKITMTCGNLTKITMTCGNLRTGCVAQTYLAERLFKHRSF